ncbi:MAG: YafY family protein [Agrobacterium cavarae]|uniref:helix-turn-helix transcriptional regulator n=1 Tax=Agrobacterium cavarae TaxID=2528239 RepID=UPI0031B4BAC5
MRKTDRLFQIIQILRRSNRPVTSTDLAGELEVSKRTVYRDISHLIAQRVPIEGEAGFGYVLDPRYDMPPLMLTPEEIESVVLGVQMVSRLNDETMRNAARDVIAKITSVIPHDLLPYITQPAVGMRLDEVSHATTSDTRLLRLAIREKRKLDIDYCATDGTVTNRIVWPVILGYADTHSLLIAWCQLRRSFRHFRTDRILNADLLDEHIGLPRNKLMQEFREWRGVEMQKFAQSQ